MNIEIRQTVIFKKWFENLKDKKVRARIDVRIRRISLGNFGDTTSVGKGIHEKNYYQFMGCFGPSRI
jgi:putative addiction module killer protein